MIDTRKTFDVAIAGAGPAGSSLAIRLASSGLGVVLIDKAKFPRDKLCGEFISGECGEHFLELGVDGAIGAADGTRLSKTVFYATNGAAVTVPSEWFGEGPALGLSRAAMDEVLMRRADELGVTICENVRVTHFQPANRGGAGLIVKFSNDRSTAIRARLIVDATGRAQAVAKLASPGNFTPNKATQVAFKTHVRQVIDVANACELYVFPGGYGGCNPVEDGRFNLCFIASAKDARGGGRGPESVLREVVFQNARAASVLANAQVVSPWLAVPITSFGKAELVPATRLLTVGDAAAFIDPFTGSGMLMAMESSKIAAEAIGEFLNSTASFQFLIEVYARKYSEVFDRRLRVSSMLRYASRSAVAAEGLIRILSLSSGITRSLARATRLSAKPRA